MLGGSWNSVALVLWRLPYWSALSLRSSSAFGRWPLGRSPGFCEPVGPCLGLVCRVGGPWGPWTCDSQASPVIPPCSFWAGSSLWLALGATRRLGCCGRRVPPGVLCFLFGGVNRRPVLSAFAGEVHGCPRLNGQWHAGIESGMVAHDLTGSGMLMSLDADRVHWRLGATRRRLAWLQLRHVPSNLCGDGGSLMSGMSHRLLTPVPVTWPLSPGARFEQASPVSSSSGGLAAIATVGVRSPLQSPSPERGHFCAHSGSRKDVRPRRRALESLTRARAPLCPLRQP